MRDLAIVAALLGVLAGIVHLATRTKRLPDGKSSDSNPAYPSEPFFTPRVKKALSVKKRVRQDPDKWTEPEDGVQPWDSYAAALARRKDR